MDHADTEPCERIWPCEYVWLCEESHSGKQADLEA